MLSQIGIHYYHSDLTKQTFPLQGELRAGDRFCQGDCQDGLFHAFLVGCPEGQKHAVELLEKYFGENVVFHTLDKRPDLHTVLQAFGIYKDGVVLVRPDGYVGYCSDNLDLEQMKKYLSDLFVQKGPAVEPQAERKEAFPFESFI